jgi:DNA-binding NtrC family response regulator
VTEGRGKYKMQNEKYKMENGKKKQLLVVDDQINLLTTLKFIFEDHGYEVSMVSSGKQALRSVKEKNFDLVLLDINMPEMDGLETFREIKKISSATAVIMMTGNRENIQIKKSIEEGAITVVYKPFAVQKLMDIMGKVLQKPLVLIVDDRRDDRAMLKNILELENFRIIEAKDGMEAAQKVQTGNFDICLVDFNMPGLNGLETIVKIKQINPKAGVILMSGTFLENEIKAELESGSGLAFIGKPYDIDRLVETINKEMKK